MSEIITGLVLGCWAWQDARERSVSILTLILGGIVLAVLWAADVPVAEWNMGTVAAAMWGAVPGFLLLTAALFPGAGIGAADGIVLLFLGLVTGTGGLMLILAYGMTAFAVCAVLLLVFGKITARSRLPFLPFVLLGYMGMYMEMR